MNNVISVSFLCTYLSYMVYNRTRKRSTRKTHRKKTRRKRTRKNYVRKRTRRKQKISRKTQYGGSWRKGGQGKKKKKGNKGNKGKRNKGNRGAPSRAQPPPAVPLPEVTLSSQGTGTSDSTPEVSHAARPQKTPLTWREVTNAGTYLYSTCIPERTDDRRTENTEAGELFVNMFKSDSVITLNIECPQGVGPGDPIKVTTEDGVEIEVDTPPNGVPGEAFKAEVSALKIWGGLLYENYVNFYENVEFQTILKTDPEVFVSDPKLVKHALSIKDEQLLMDLFVMSHSSWIFSRLLTNSDFHRTCMESGLFQLPEEKQDGFFKPMATDLLYGVDLFPDTIHCTVEDIGGITITKDLNVQSLLFKNFCEYLIKKNYFDPKFQQLYDQLSESEKIFRSALDEINGLVGEKTESSGVITRGITEYLEDCSKTAEGVGLLADEEKKIPELVSIQIVEMCTPLISKAINPMKNLHQTFRDLIDNMMKKKEALLYQHGVYGGGLEPRVSVKEVLDMIEIYRQQIVKDSDYIIFEDLTQLDKAVKEITEKSKFGFKTEIDMIRDEVTKRERLQLEAKKRHKKPEARVPDLSGDESDTEESDVDVIPVPVEQLEPEPESESKTQKGILTQGEMDAVNIQAQEEAEEHSRIMEELMNDVDESVLHEKTATATDTDLEGDIPYEDIDVVTSFEGSLMEDGSLQTLKGELQKYDGFEMKPIGKNLSMKNSNVEYEFMNTPNRPFCFGHMIRSPDNPEYVYTDYVFTDFNLSRLCICDSKSYVLSGIDSVVIARIPYFPGSQEHKDENFIPMETRPLSPDTVYQFITLDNLRDILQDTLKDDCELTKLCGLLHTLQTKGLTPPLTNDLSSQISKLAENEVGLRYIKGSSVFALVYNSIQNIHIPEAIRILKAQKESDNTNSDLYDILIQLLEKQIKLEYPKIFFEELQNMMYCPISEYTGRPYSVGGGSVIYLIASQIVTRIQKYKDRGFTVYFSDGDEFQPDDCPWYQSGIEALNTYKFLRGASPRKRVSISFDPATDQFTVS
jgi:hypothetical protein